MDTERVMEVLRQVEWCIFRYRRWENHCPVCGGKKRIGHRDGCKLAALLDEANKEIEYPTLAAIANTARHLRRNANMLRAVHSNADYIPAHLLALLYEVLDDFDVLDKEARDD